MNHYAIATGQTRLARSFYTRDGLTLAPELLGKILVHHTPEGVIRGVITEVEAYMGETDKGSHTYGGRRTERTEPMYHIGGTSYVYLIYGMYSCMNIAAATEGIPQAVLLRSVVAADEESRERMCRLRLEQMSRRAKKPPHDRAEGNTGKTGRSAGSVGAAAPGAAAGIVETQLPSALRRHLSDGPGKMCIAMGISREDNDKDLVAGDDFYVTEGICVEPSRICTAKRIGIDYAQEAADYLWRFYIEPQEMG